MENSKNKQFLSFKSHAVLSSVIKSLVIPLCPACVCIQLTLILLDNEPNGNSVMSKRSHKILILSEKLCRYRKKHSIYRVQCYPWFLASAGGLGIYSPWMRGTTLIVPML